MTRESLKALARDLALATREFIQLRDAKIAAVEKRVEALERHPLPKWHGPHEPGKQYSEASLVTKAGALWVATGPTSETPGAGSSSWRLIVKSGAHREER